MNQKFAVFSKVSRGLVSQIPPSDYMDLESISNSVPYYKKGKLYVPKGDIKFNYGYEAEDFYRNLITMIAERDIQITRVPRIVKRLYKFIP